MNLLIHIISNIPNPTYNAIHYVLAIFHIIFMYILIKLQPKAQ